MASLSLAASSCFSHSASFRSWMSMAKHTVWVVLGMGLFCKKWQRYEYSPSGPGPWCLLRYRTSKAVG
ncbi:hypothetical protein DSO57_1006443 [Entomophthora muscae]|uniref:Uncharacterized protein n=2 Tax=Entomophthora muscae TaxID=34485 RepID=A0ACC2UT28_9FUNG|nr:hypothetical protein DSO57_1002573 [Entomophthora muscae]KAJ9090050.1 hypothetical protein DSO57_1006443 [Entomophthora muscae]